MGQMSEEGSRSTLEGAILEVKSKYRSKHGRLAGSMRFMLRYKAEEALVDFKALSRIYKF